MPWKFAYPQWYNTAGGPVQQQGATAEEADVHVPGAESPEVYVGMIRGEIAPEGEPEAGS